MRNLLLVDDDRDFLQLLSSMLQTDFQVYEATGMTEAIKIFESVQVNAICSDFAMPDGTGIGLLQKVRHADIQIPFLLISGNDDHCLENTAMKYGATFCCKTDFELLKKIKGL